MVYNHIGRAYGILANAHSISSKETMNLLSLMRLGVDVGLFPGVDRSLVDELFILTQPAHLQKQHSEKLSAEERDLLRADMVRERLQSVSRPVAQPPSAALRDWTNRPSNCILEYERSEAMNNFTPRAQQVLALARKEADRFNHNFVGTEHLLLGPHQAGPGRRRQCPAEARPRPGDGAPGSRKAGRHRAGSEDDGQHPLHAAREEGAGPGAERSQGAQPHLRRAPSTSCWACSAKATAWPRACSRTWMWTSSRPARRS